MLPAILVESWQRGTGGILEEVYADQSPDLEGMTAALKCVACMQVFVVNANIVKSNKVKVAGSWKPVPRSTP